MMRTAQKPHVLIIGGGVSGLSTAYFLQEAAQDQVALTVLEQAPRLGGWIETLNEEGFLFEQGPRGCRPRDAGLETLALADRLGLREAIIPASADAQRRFLYLNGRLRGLPQSVKDVCTSPFVWPALLRMVAEPLYRPGKSEDESIASFASRRLGRYTAENFLDPMTLGIYGGDIHTLSMRSCYTRLWDMEQEHGSLLKALWQRRHRRPAEVPEWMQPLQSAGLFSFRKGMQQLIDGLEKHLQPSSIHCSTPVLSLQRDGVQWLAKTARRQFRADAVVCAVAPQLLARLIDLPLLGQQEALSLHTVNLAWRKRVSVPHGFGYLVPSKEGSQVLGMVWDSETFPQQNQGEETRVTVMLRGDCVDPLGSALEALNAHIGLSIPPDYVQTRLAQEAIPQYKVGHHRWLEALRHELTAQFPGLSLVGNAYEGVGVNDCVVQAKSEAARLWKCLRSEQIEKKTSDL
jgi:oxygen-dependent protoporphyrinogen oxidase